MCKKHVSRTEALVGGGVESVQQTAQAAGQVIRDPVGTVAKIPESVGGLFSRVEKRLGARAAGEGNLPPLGQEGIAKERRSLAQELGVDPYTDNPLLSDKLDQVARWKRGGGLAVGVATGAASMWAGIATKTANLVWTQSPDEVRSTNEKRLQSLLPNASMENIRAFLDNPAFTPTTQSLFVDQLESLPALRGRDSSVRLAGRMGTHDQAHFLVAAIGLLSTYHERVGPLASVESRSLLPVALSTSGSLILPVPVDCLAWTERLVAFRNRADLRATKREILLSGSATSRARKELSAPGWVLREQF